MDIKKRKEELTEEYKKTKEAHENAANVMKQAEQKMQQLDGAFQELTRIEREEAQDKSKEEKNGKK